MAAADEDPRDAQRSRTGRNWSRRGLILATSAIGVALSIGGFLVVRELQDARAVSDFQGFAEDRVAVVSVRLLSTLQHLEALYAFWVASDEVRRDEFETFASRLIAADNSVQALEWAPRVTRTERATFEAESATAVPGFQVREIGPGGTLQPAAERDEYFPVAFVHPVETNADVLGLDLYSEVRRRQALEQARDQGTPVVSRALGLVQAPGDESGFLCVWPLFDRTRPIDTIARRRAALSGYLVGAYRLAEIARHAVAGLAPLPSHTQIRIHLPTGEAQVLFDTLDPAADDQSTMLQLASADVRTHGQRWRIDCRAGPGLLHSRRGPWPWLTLLAGLLLTATMALALRQHELRAQALMEVNAQLVREAGMLESLRETQKLESLGVLAGGIAHDFNNLLTGILGNADLALRMLPTGSDARSCVAQAVDAAQRAAGLTAQLLAYAGKATLEREVVCLGGLVRDMSDLLRTALPAGVVLDLELDDGDPLEVAVDRTQMQQLVLNLVSNGAEACESGGRVLVRIRRQAAAGAGERPRICLEVQDNGIGMTAEVQQRMFDPFFTTKFTGRGLGLAAVRGIVRTHDGSIQVDTTPGHGTTVRVLLPTAPGQREQPCSEEPQPAQAPGTILVLDDERLVLEVATRLLTDLGYRVLPVTRGEEAIATLRRHRGEVDLAILDVTLPGTSGPAVLQHLRQVSPDLQVLFSSGFHETELAELVRSSGVAGFLQKPYTRETLVRKVAQAMARRDAAGERGAQDEASG